jgi:hypothetical protein
MESSIDNISILILPIEQPVSLPHIPELLILTLTIMEYYRFAVHEPTCMMFITGIHALVFLTQKYRDRNEHISPNYNLDEVDTAIKK